MTRWVIGLDFDNTLVSYDEVMRRVAIARGAIPPDLAGGKREIRDHIRRAPGGEQVWRQLQAQVYGPDMPQARLVDGVPAFLARCQHAGIPVRIVSHKTEFAQDDGTQTNLRDTALAWMAQHGFFAPDGLGLCRADVFFETTRAEKIGRITQLGCTHFIDDLEETLLDPAFPAGVERLLYAPTGVPALRPEIRCMASWQEIHDHFFAPVHHA